MSVPYQGRELALYREAMRVVPAIASARARGADADVQGLYEAFLRDAEEICVPRSTAWSILTVASQVIIAGLVNYLAEIEETTSVEVSSRLVVAAVDQAATSAY